ncbi:uncharacterized protein STEHIDRAFT_163979 [Stereum hirsutum FP-91666 SS1]|uniref:Uncharacterized protein n=1 Tax=Stereum hirsutum (strain FP-91666) TaxID=721885 RepID=R7RVK6_STEHR|nr:uncharacterized protein STEHIDRAFT_163979 [Stereum hirsutum FP-91666 SS1]EIM79116.1 hypothetical protein STEHIDRAFT_163979 [Stereum hirsutum FP-91666 SS1]
MVDIEAKRAEIGSRLAAAKDLRRNDGTTREIESKHLGIGIAVSWDSLRVMLKMFLEEYSTISDTRATAIAVIVIMNDVRGST